ncbi:NonSMC condensin II complex_ subunit D3 [Caligus rogercresseyi]|uniref:NonSMC condensin II complex_ subunit D3 n=1 Tax=Caligus rogercresseyi TaxID=217165 RepID=A0A7T8KI45_CALRO|nr:NonSMC condensin II complex_ subunit D3 [Caligus rogercresseyi]
MDVATVVSQLDARDQDGSVDTEKYHSNIESWTCQILDTIESEALHSRSKDREDTDPHFLRQLFTLGELALIIPWHIKEKQFLFVQTSPLRKAF